MSAFTEETVTGVRHWTDTLFSFTTTRTPSFRFTSGRFTMIGLLVDGRPLMRAYSMASASYEEELEFLSIKVPDGPLTSRLRHVKEGDRILVGAKTTGTLVIDHLKPGRSLYLFSTGTGLAPFLSIIRDPEVYEKFERIILTHTVRHGSELAYRRMITQELPSHELVGDLAAEKLIYYPTVTREPFERQGRITDLIRSGRLTVELGLADLDPAEDRCMVCGNPAMVKEMSDLLEQRGFTEGSSGEPGEYVLEKAFAQR